MRQERLHAQRGGVGRVNPAQYRLHECGVKLKAKAAYKKGRTAFVVGVVGYFFKKMRYPLAPLVLALVLGDMAETAFRQSMLLSNGSLSIFWSNGLVGSIMTLALVLLAWPLVSGALEAWRARLRAAERAADELRSSDEGRRPADAGEAT